MITVPSNLTKTMLRTSSIFVSLALCGVARAQEVTAPCTNQAPICYGERALCSISVPTQFDSFRLSGTAGDQVWVTIAMTGGCWNPYITVYNPDGSPNASTSCVGCPCATRLPLVLTQSGTHTIVVSDAGQQYTGSYALDVQRIPPQGDVLTLDYGQTRTITIDHPGDVDWLRVELLAGTNVNLATSMQSGCFNPWIGVFDAAGQPVTSTSCVGCPCSNLLTFAPVQTTGTYFVALADATSIYTGAMDVTLSCLIGNCPPPNPPAPLGTAFCAQTLNSTGRKASISALGSPNVTQNDVYLHVDHVPAGKLSIVLLGSTPTQVPLYNSWGPRCIGSPFRRLAPTFTCNDNTMHRQLDLTTLPMITPGTTWYFQAWFRDPAGTPPKTSNTSDGLRIDFQ
jgi:hypothetical protein